MEAQDRSRIASGRVFASGCSYHTSSAPLCCSGCLPPSLPPVLHRDVQKLLPHFCPRVSLILTAAVCPLRLLIPPPPRPDYEETHKGACFRRNRVTCSPSPGGPRGPGQQVDLKPRASWTARRPPASAEPLHQRRAASASPQAYCVNPHKVTHISFRGCVGASPGLRRVCVCVS